MPFEVLAAQKRATKMEIENLVSFSEADYVHAGFPDASFTKILTSESLVHSYDLEKTLQEFHRLLKPGGKILLSEYTLAPDEQFNTREKEVMDAIIKGASLDALRGFRHNEFSEKLKAAGFKNIKEYDVTKNVLPQHKFFKQLATIPYAIHKLLGTEKYFINTMAGYELSGMVEKDLWKHVQFVAEK